jgi:acetyl esterase/lipase
MDRSSTEAWQIVVPAAVGLLGAAALGACCHSSAAPAAPQDAGPAQPGWRVSAPGQTSAPETLEFCIRALRREYNGEGYHENVETLCDARVVAGTSITKLPAEAAARVVVPWTRPAEPPAARGECEWVVPARSAASKGGRRRVLFCHGGGYTGCRPSDYRGLVSRIAAASGLPCLLFDYRKAPEHPFPAAVDDAVSAYLWIASHGPGLRAEDAEEVVLMGDSAGGGIALAVALRLHRLGQHAPDNTYLSALELPSDAALRVRLRAAPAPRLRLVTLSAYTDLSCSTPSYETRLWDEAALTGDACFSSGDHADDVESSRKWAEQYAPRAVAARHPECSPYYAGAAALAALPEALMIVGDEELMLAETTELAARAKAAGAAVSLTVYPRMWHVFPMYSEACAMPRTAGQPAAVVVEAEDAIDEIARFLAAPAADP